MENDSPQRITAGQEYSATLVVGGILEHSHEGEGTVQKRKSLLRGASLKRPVKNRGVSECVLAGG